MISSNFRFSLDIHSTQSQVSVPATIGDTARVLRISLTDGGKPYHIADGCLAVISIKRPTGTFVEEFCVIEDNATIVYDFAQHEYTAIVEGIHNCSVTLYGEDGRAITSPRFTMVVTQRVVKSDDINITDDDRTLVDSMIANETARNDAETARVKAESERVIAEEAREDAEAIRRKTLADLHAASYTFYATYGVTTHAELLAEKAFGKSLCVKGSMEDKSVIFPFSYYDEESETFAFAGMRGHKSIVVYENNNTWSTETIDFSDVVIQSELSNVINNILEASY